MNVYSEFEPTRRPKITVLPFPLSWAPVERSVNLSHFKVFKLFAFLLKFKSLSSICSGTNNISEVYLVKSCFESFSQCKPFTNLNFFSSGKQNHVNCSICHQKTAPIETNHQGSVQLVFRDFLRNCSRLLVWTEVGISQKLLNHRNTMRNPNL